MIMQQTEVKYQAELYLQNHSNILCSYHLLTRRIYTKFN